MNTDNLMKWLERKGLWQKFQQSKNDKAKRLRANGLPRDKAREEAWKWAMARYDVPQEALDDPNYEPPEDLGADALWVYHHLYSRVKREDAPSPGAWGMMAIAREDPQKFIAQILPRYTGQKKASDAVSEGQIHKADQDKIDDIKRMIQERTK